MYNLCGGPYRQYQVVSLMEYKNIMTLLLNGKSFVLIVRVKCRDNTKPLLPNNHQSSYVLHFTGCPSVSKQYSTAHRKSPNREEQGPKLGLRND